MRFREDAAMADDVALLRRLIARTGPALAKRFGRAPESTRACVASVLGDAAMRPAGLMHIAGGILVDAGEPTWWHNAPLITELPGGAAHLANTIHRWCDTACLAALLYDTAAL